MKVPTKFIKRPNLIKLAFQLELSKKQVGLSLGYVGRLEQPSWNKPKRQNFGFLN